MKKITIYHGSSSIINQPTFGKGKRYNDYGLGFYCTYDFELAKEWACTEGMDGYANQYEIDISKLKILDLSKYSILSWLAILLDNREVKLYTPIEKKGKTFLLENYLPDYYDYDVIIGYRADDSFFSFVRSFLSNTISIHQLEYIMKLGKLKEQFVLKSKKAFNEIKYIDSVVASNEIYYVKRKNRDYEARKAFNLELENEDINGIYLRDIIKERTKTK